MEKMYAIILYNFICNFIVLILYTIFLHNYVPSPRHLYIVGINMDHMSVIKKNESKKEKTNRLTTISISRKNRSLLKRMGQTSDSFNDVLTRLLKNNSLLESASRVGTREKTLTNSLLPPVKGDDKQ